jgi:hypothetical protein
MRKLFVGELKVTDQKQFNGRISLIAEETNHGIEKGQAIHSCTPRTWNTMTVPKSVILHRNKLGGLSVEPKTK